MKFITHNDEEVDVNGTHLQGYINVDYNKLRAILGESHSFEDDTVATIYNWKNGPNYGAVGVTPDMIREWHVGGHNSRAVEKVKKILLTA